MRGLQKRGQQVVPLKYRRETPLKPLPVEALCDFESDQVSCCLDAPGRLGPDLPRLASPKGPKGDVARCQASNIFWNLCLSLSLGSLSANPSHCPGLLFYQLSNPSHSSRSPREGSHWPNLSHVFSLNQSLWLEMPFSHWPGLSHMSTPRSQGMKSHGLGLQGASTKGNPGGC